ncbi:reverse transcriptase domain-containing protein [Endozoicomonas sp. GU-1]|uniref:reverse transcriptase domain-containing protein n=1 Tax=Endozoicomonas sp. GU-1 TaxID=3009078 RepID=UPI0022B3111A|nr:reverse transcriptase domain-containing protein [Endozoicomonas sp. GU-1]WBA81981.1 reverse transcriptase domain-containing protein [Endozoicomonas sp. GU-1]WBA84930.1 reverse transcriptase domain-containing protein [Endozoicomonas sp. GU-1]
MPSYPKWVSKFELKPGVWVFVPSKESVNVGRSIKDVLEGCWFAPGYYYHLKKGGHVKALKSHTSGKFFIHLDLKRFFYAINRSRITRSLKEYLGYEKAREIAIASTVPAPDSQELAYILPFGFVQSPILASVCLRHSKLGTVLHRLSKAKGTEVSVYVDDIVISTQSLETAEAALTQVKEAAERSRFPLNTDKEEGPAEKVTAFNIELSHSSLVLSDQRFDKFLEIYQYSENYHQIAGILGYIESVNHQQSLNIK